MPEGYHYIMESVGWRAAGMIMFSLPLILVAIVVSWLITSHVKRKRYKAENTAKQLARVERMSAAKTGTGK